MDESTTDYLRKLMANPGTAQGLRTQQSVTSQPSGATAASMFKSAYSNIRPQSQGTGFVGGTFAPTEPVAKATEAVPLYKGDVEKQSPISVGQRAELAFGDEEGRKNFLRRLGYRVLTDETGSTLIEKDGKVYPMDEKNFNIIKDTVDLAGMVLPTLGLVAGGGGGPIGMAAGAGIGETLSEMIGKSLGTRESMSPGTIAAEAGGAFLGGKAGQYAMKAGMALAPKLAAKYGVGTAIERLPGFLAREAAVQSTFGGAQAFGRTAIETGDISQGIEAVPSGVVGGLALGIPMAGAARFFKMPSGVAKLSAKGEASIPKPRDLNFAEPRVDTSQEALYPNLPKPRDLNFNQPETAPIGTARIAGVPSARNVEPIGQQQSWAGAIEPAPAEPRIPTKAPVTIAEDIMDPIQLASKQTGSNVANPATLIEAARIRLQQLEKVATDNAVMAGRQGVTGDVTALSGPEAQEYQILKTALDTNDTGAIAKAYGYEVGAKIEIPFAEAPTKLPTITEETPYGEQPVKKENIRRPPLTDKGEASARAKLKRIEKEMVDNDSPDLEAEAARIRARLLETKRAAIKSKMVEAEVGAPALAEGALGIRKIPAGQLVSGDILVVDPTKASGKKVSTVATASDASATHVVLEDGSYKSYKPDELVSVQRPPATPVAEAAAPAATETGATGRKTISATAVRPGDTIVDPESGDIVKVSAVSVIDDGTNVKVALDDGTDIEIPSATKVNKVQTPKEAEATEVLPKPKAPVNVKPRMTDAEIIAAAEQGKFPGEGGQWRERAPGQAPQIKGLKERTDNVINKLIAEPDMEAQRTAITERQARARSERTSKLAGIDAAIADGRISPAEGRAAKGRLLSEPLTTREASGVANMVTQGDFDDLILRLSSSKRLTPWERVNLTDALHKLIYENTVPQPNQLKLFEIEFGNTLTGKLMQTIQHGVPLVNKIVAGANMMKSMVSMADFSAFLRQGLIQTISHPTKSIPALIKSMKWAFDLSGESYNMWFDTVKNDEWFRLLREHDIPLEIMDPGSFTISNSAREEAFMGNVSNWFDNVPVIGKVLKGLYLGSERAYTGFLNKLRWDVFRSEAGKLVDSGLSLKQHPESFRALAKWIMTSTGRGDLGALNKAADVLNTTFFSPKLIKARLDLFNPWYYKNLTPEIRSLAFKDMAKFIGTGMTLLQLAKLGGADVEADPHSADFGKIKIGDIRYDIWGGIGQYIRFFTQVASGQIKTGAGDVMYVDKDVAPFTTRADIIERFGRGKLSPGVQLLWDSLAGENLVGEVTDADMGEVWSRIAPFYMQDIADAGKVEGWQGALAVGIPAMLGVGTQTYAPSQTAIAQRHLETMLSLPADQQAEYYGQVTKADPDIGAILKQRYKNDLMKMTDYEIYMRKLPVDRRAQKIFEELNKINTAEEQQAYWQNIISKKILTSDVYRQLMLLSEPTPDNTNVFTVISKDGRQAVMRLTPEQVQEAETQGFTVQ